VAAVLGTYNSSTAQSAAPILAQRSIVQVSPANIGPALTRGENAATDPRRPFLSYFQVAANDLVQGQIGARHLVQKAGKKRIAVIEDGKTYGVGLVGNFVAEAERLVAREKVGEKDTDFSSPIAAIRSSRPDAVYYGGEYPAAGPLARQVRGGGPGHPIDGRRRSWVVASDRSLQGLYASTSRSLQSG
jgi:branched-chain amino acid transport system substrate-binding protein